MGKQKKGKIPYYERTAANDIPYRGPLSYRHLQIFGWLSISCFIIAKWTNLGLQMDPGSPTWMHVLNLITDLGGTFAIPLFLLANFCIILDEKKSYKDLLIRNAALTLVVVVLYILIFNHYLVGMLYVFTENWSKSLDAVAAIIQEGTRTGTLTFNLFIDLFLCTLFMFFVNHIPEKGYFKDHIRQFRLLSLIPIIYEVGSLMIRMLSARGIITPSFYIYPILTTKPPMTFVFFVALVLYIKVRERRFKKHGKTHKQYKVFLKTNANSFQFSIFATIVLVITCIIDLILLVVSLILSMSSDDMNHFSLLQSGTVKTTEAVASDIGNESSVIMT